MEGAPTSLRRQLAERAAGTFTPRADVSSGTGARVTCAFPPDQEGSAARGGRHDTRGLRPLHRAQYSRAPTPGHPASLRLWLRQRIHSRRTPAPTGDGATLDRHGSVAVPQAGVGSPPRPQWADCGEAVAGPQTDPGAEARHVPCGGSSRAPPTVAASGLRHKGSRGGWAFGPGGVEARSHGP